MIFNFGLIFYLNVLYYAASWAHDYIGTLESIAFTSQTHKWGQLLK